ncbi:MAG TPA: phosphatidylserine decarboxylase family protein [Acidobacteriaceae bacterium]|jgi:phosphatidylserine decarboxylase|nr:phosphatidylserine decarboxylase family protein [Acidobacteriaceae bacterium]
MVQDGYFYGLGFFAAAAAAWKLTGYWGWAAVPFLLALFFLWFFRDPERQAPEGAGLIVSPADGKVTEVLPVRTEAGDRIRLSIFLSVFNVHVNRSPIAGRISKVVYRKGKYLNALNPASAVENEQNTVTVEGEGCEVVFKQIAGLLARRIVFRPKAGDLVTRGERVGLIKFGSRVDVLLPGDARVRVTIGERVSGGSSILAELGPVNRP